MAEDTDDRDRLWAHYKDFFEEMDDLTLGRWMAQSLSQFSGRIWRFSHPMLETYRLAAQVGHDRQVWLKRFGSAPAGYAEAACCRAPLMGLFTRDVKETGVVCYHCAETAIAFKDLPIKLQHSLSVWAEEYGPVHAIAHWDEGQRKSFSHPYEETIERGCEQAKRLLLEIPEMVKPLLDLCGAVAWEDQDECLDIRPEDLMDED